MSLLKNKQNNQKLFFSQQYINNTFKNENFYLKEEPILEKSAFELKNYYKSNNFINDIMKEEKFNMINEIKQLNKSIHKSQNNNNDIDDE